VTNGGMAQSLRTLRVTQGITEMRRQKFAIQGTQSIRGNKPLTMQTDFDSCGSRGYLCLPAWCQRKFVTM